MKLRLLRLLKWAAVPTLLALGFSTPVSAQALHYTCDTVPTLSFSDIIIEQDGDCTLTKKIEARSITFNIQGSIISSNGDIKATTGILKVTTSGDMNFTKGDLWGGTFVELHSGGLIKIRDRVISNFGQNPDVDGNILIQAVGNISIKQVKTGGELNENSPRSGAVQIDANQGGANTPFLIGAASDNGISEFIDTRSTIGGGSNQIFTIGGVRVTNGFTSSTGGITVVSSNVIRVQNSSSKSGWIILNAQNGKLEIRGNLKSDGTAGFGAGNIFLLADTVETADTVKISADQDDNATFGHQILISAKDIKYFGGAGLKISADGKANPQVVSVYLVPKNNLVPLSTNNVTALTWSFQQPTPIGQLDSELNFIGFGSKLDVSANGNDAQILITGYPIKFQGGRPTITAKGNSGQKITIGFFGQFQAKEGLVFQTNERVLLDASAKSSDGNGGIIYTSVDQATLLSPNHIFRSNALTGGNGKGGDVYFINEMMNLADAPKVQIEADGSEGKGGNIFLSTKGNTANLRLRNGDFSLSAKGGANTSGQGSAIFIVNNSTSLTEILRPDENEPAVDASSQSGNGGFIKISGSSQISMPRTNYPSPDYVALDARGRGGLGGTVYLGTPNLVGDGSKVTRNILALVRVEGADSIGTNQLYGRIGVDVDGQGVFCRQWKTELSWPKSYWNCTSPENPDPFDSKIVDAANAIPAALKAQLSNTLSSENSRVQIFLMSDYRSSYPKFFFTNAIAPFQYQFGITNLDPNRVSVAFALAEDANGNLAAVEALGNSSTMRQGTIVHELGHQLDFIWGDLSKQALWKSLRTSDFNAMDTNPCNVVFSQALCTQFGGPQQKPSRVFLTHFSQVSSSGELFAVMFEHIISKNSGATPLFSADPDLEKALEYLPDMRDQMEFWVNNPPAAVQ